MDSSEDFMPTQHEFEMIVEKIENSVHRRAVSSLVQGSRKKSYPRVFHQDQYITGSKKQKVFYLDDKNSEPHYDTYDEYGRNISKQERRQELVPWVKVVYRNGKLYIPVDKKNALRSLRLL